MTNPERLKEEVKVAVEKYRAAPFFLTDDDMADVLEDVLEDLNPPYPFSKNN